MPKIDLLCLYKGSIKALFYRFILLVFFNLGKPVHELTFPLCLKFFVDSIRGESVRKLDFHNYFYIFIILITTRAFMEFCMRMDGFLSIKTFPLFRNYLREKLFTNELNSPLVYARSSRSGIAPHYILEVVRSMESTVKLCISVLIPISVMFVASSILLINKNFIFSLIILIWFALHIMLSLYSLKNSLKSNRIYTKTLAKLQKNLFDALENLFSIKTSNTILNEINYLKKNQNRERAAYERFGIYQEKIKLLFSILCFLVLTTMIGLCCYFYSQKQLTMGDLTFILSLVFSLNGYLWYISMRFTEVIEEVGSQKSIIKKLKIQQETLSSFSPKSLFKRKSEISFENVFFRYLDVQDIFNKMNLQIFSGEKVGILGPSGSGKTTIAKLLMRFIKPQKGAVFLNNKPLNSIDQNILYSQIGMLPQETTLFNRTIQENITYGSSKGKDYIKCCLEWTCSSEFIENLYFGINTVVGSSGVSLSVGQKQRLMIVRLLMQSPQIMIFDECTSGIDLNTSEKIMKNLLKHFPDKTMIFITHRVQFLSMMDKIFFLNKKRVESYPTTKAFDSLITI